MVRAVTGSVSWALPFGFVADFRGGGGQEEDGGNERGKKTRARGAGGGTCDILDQIDFYKPPKGSSVFG